MEEILISYQSEIKHYVLHFYNYTYFYSWVNVSMLVGIGLIIKGGARNFYFYFLIEGARNFICRSKSNIHKIKKKLTNI